MIARQISRATARSTGVVRPRRPRPATRKWHRHGDRQRVETASGAGSRHLRTSGRSVVGRPPRIDGHGYVTGSGALLQRARQPARNTRRAADPRSTFAGADPSSRTAAQLRHSPSRRGRRSAGRTGIARPCKPADHAGLHSCEQGAPAFGVLRNASTGLRG